MRTPLVLLVTALACGCSNGRGPPLPDAGVAQLLTYTPAGCMYSVTPPASRAYLNMALDDTSPFVDAGTSDGGNGAAPERVRLGLGGNTTEGQPGYPDPTTSAVFTWETQDLSHAAKVKIGPSATSLTDVYAGYVWTTPSPTAAIGADEPPTNMHEVHVCGLTPATTYYYEVGGGPMGQEVWSATQSFTTLPKAGPITVGIMGDARDLVTTWQLAHERMLAKGVAAMLFSGDVVDIGTEELLYTNWLDAIWQDPTDPSGFLTLGQIMFLPTPGNHENEAVRFYAAFAVPGNGPYAKSFNSFNIGSAHFVMIDDQPIGLMEAAQADAELAWLEQDLAAADNDRTNHPFIIAIGHRGLFSTCLHATDGDVLTARGALAPLYDKYHVDLVFNGHDHEYERSKPLNAGNPPTGAPNLTCTSCTTYIICAGAGADPYAVGTSPGAYREISVSYGGSPEPDGGPDPFIGTYGFLTITDTQLSFSAYGLTGAGGMDPVIDTFQLP